MSNMPSVNKTRLTMRIDLRMRAKLRTECRKRGQDENAVLGAALSEYLKGVEPDEEDVKWIKEERKRNEIMRKR